MQFVAQTVMFKILLHSISTHLTCVCLWAQTLPYVKEKGRCWVNEKHFRVVRLEKIKLLFLAPGYQHRVFPGPPSAIRGLMDDQPGQQQGALMEWWRSDSGCESKRFWSQEEIVFSQTQPGSDFLLPGWLLVGWMYWCTVLLTVWQSMSCASNLTHTAAKALILLISLPVVTLPLMTRCTKECQW